MPKEVSKMPWLHQINPWHFQDQILTCLLNSKRKMKMEMCSLGTVEELAILYIVVAFVMLAHVAEEHVSSVIIDVI